MKIVPPKLKANSFLIRGWGCLNQVRQPLCALRATLQHHGGLDHNSENVNIALPIDTNTKSQRVGDITPIE